MCSFSIRRGCGGAQFRIVFPFWWSLMKCYYTTLIHTFRQRARRHSRPRFSCVLIYIYIYMYVLHVLDASTYIHIQCTHTLHIILACYATLWLCLRFRFIRPPPPPHVVRGCPSKSDRRALCLFDYKLLLYI